MIREEFKYLNKQQITEKVQLWHYIASHTHKEIEWEIDKIRLLINACTCHEHFDSGLTGRSIQSAVLFWLERILEDSKFLQDIYSRINDSDKSQCDLPWCNTLFTPKRNDNRFCCEEHRTTYHNKCKDK